MMHIQQHKYSYVGWFILVSVLTYISLTSDFQLVILWTDALIYVLLATSIAFGIYTYRHEHLREPWRRVARRRIAMGSLVFLSVYIVIGLLDSIHYKVPLDEVPETGRVIYSPEVYSLLDSMTSALREKKEKTYSAPFASRLYSKETVERADGSVSREFPRLKHGAAHLDNPDKQKLADIAYTLSISLAQAVLIMLIVIAGVVIMIDRNRRTGPGTVIKDIYAGRYEIPWKTILASIFAVSIVSCAIMNLSTDYHVFGTDKVGQDVLYLSLKSMRTGLVIGTLTTLVMLPFAVMMGISAGYFGGWIDDIIQYIYTTLNSIPGVLLIAAAVLILQVYIDGHQDLFSDVISRADARLLFLCIILGVTSWTGLCRLLRGETLKLREVDYIEAATAFGVNHLTIIWRHILPNLMHIVLISVVLDFSGLVLAEAVLSYVGVGVDPSMNSWGNMINAARLEMAREPIVWWPLLAAFVFMFILVLCSNLFSDAVRDAFDPRLRTQQ